jgi:cytochrome c2
MRKSGRKSGLFVLVLGCALAIAGNALADGNAKKGKRIFNKCKACHSLEEGKNKIGPSLHGLFGRKSGTAAKYRYSKAMKGAGVVWNEKTLDQYLKRPRKFVKGTKMAFPGLRKEDDREDLIAFLKEATK